MTKKTYQKPELISIGHIPMDFVEQVLNLNQSAAQILDYWIIYKEIQILRESHTVMDSFMKLGERMGKSSRTIELYYYRAKKIIDKLNVE